MGLAVQFAGFTDVLMLQETVSPQRVLFAWHLCKDESKNEMQHLRKTNTRHEVRPSLWSVNST